MSVVWEHEEVTGNCEATSLDHGIADRAATHEDWHFRKEVGRGEWQEYRGCVGRVRHADASVRDIRKDGFSVDNVDG